MTKYSGSYDSIVRGVSQQTPSDRLSGQHTEQVNMVSDPVRGLVRRHGSVTLSEAQIPHDFDNLYANTASHRVFTFSSGNDDYDLLYRSGLRPIIADHDDTFFCYSREAAQFIPVVVQDTIATQALRRAGVSAIGRVGRFALMSGNAYETTWTSVEQFDTAENKARMAVWIRGGAYSRTYTLTLTDALSGDKTVLEHTTPSASYPNDLDTTDLLTSDPDYQKKVNDRVNAYNSEVTKWIGTSAAAITPAAICEELKTLYDALGFDPAEIEGSTMLIDDDRWGEVSINDGGDNSLAEAVGNIVEAAEDMCPVHYVGKVVKVRPSEESPDSAYYLRAYPKDDVSTGVAEVTWREGTSAIYTPERLFVIGVVEDDTLYVSDDLEWLEEQVGASTADDIPTYQSSAVGDDITNPLPYFMGETIDYIGMIQDRLLVGSGPFLTASKTGDYFNFWSTSALTSVDNDPFELYSLGSEEDVIKYGTQFNRDLILYGEKGQYAISGGQVLTAKTASIVTVSKYEASIDAEPKVSGNFAFYATKRGAQENRVSTLNQIQPASLSENPESIDLSQQLDDYIRGTTQEIVTVTSPDTVVLRTDATRTGLYLYNYLDRGGQERILDAWHRWSWSPYLGHLVGVTKTPDGDLLVYLIRRGSVGETWLACERFSLSGDLSTRPYMDGLRLVEYPGSFDGMPYTPFGVAYPEGDNAFEGSTLEELGGDVSDMGGAYLGINYTSYVTPTNPYPKDSKDKVITFGRFTLGPVRISVADTGGAEVYATTYLGKNKVLDFNGFIVNHPSAVPDTQPIVTTSLQAYIGAEVREGSFTVQSKRWLPLSITTLEWSGQMFNRQRRA